MTDDLWKHVLSESRRQAETWVGLDTEEITSETVFRAFLWLRGNPAASDQNRVRALVRTIARRVGWRLAKQKKSVSLSIDAEIVEAGSVENVAARTERYYLALTESISLLSEEDRLVVERFMSGESLAALGRELGITRQSMHKRFSKILGRLQALVELHRGP